jgi:histidinol-phosphate aminotransferase
VLSSRRSFLSVLGSGGLALAGGACAGRRAPSAGASTPLPVGGPDDPLGVIRIGSNENPYGPGQAALAAVREAVPLANRYAFGATHDTVDAIAAHVRVPADHVGLGCGSSEILDAAVTAFTSPHHGLVTASPSFELPAERATTSGAPVGEVRVDAHGRLDLDAMGARATGVGLVYLCNPNNPTSTVHGIADVRTFIEQVHRRSPAATVLVDEAYHEYVDAPEYDTAIPIAVSDPRVLVIRTFSKIHGMAGLRVGYAVGQPSTVRRLRPWLGGMTMSVLSAAAARASLADTAHVAQQRALNREARAYTLAVLAPAGGAAFDSQANFVMVDVGRDCRSFAAACASRGVRIARSFPALAHHARITVGTLAEMRHATAVFVEVLKTSPRVTASWPRPSWVDHACREC